MSALGLQRVLGFGSYETAWAWLQKLRRAMEPTSGMLRGEVEVDETFVGGHEPGLLGGRQTKTKSKVIIAVEHHGPRMAAGRVWMRQIPNFKGPTLVGFIQEVVEPARPSFTDGWSGYNRVQGGLPSQPPQPACGTKEAHEALPAVHRVAVLMKRCLLSTHQGAVRPSHLDFYLAEWCFHFNRRRSGHRGPLFYNLLKQSAMTPPQPYAELLSPIARDRRDRKRKLQARRRAAGKTSPIKTTLGRGQSAPAAPRTACGKSSAGATPRSPADAPDARGHRSVGY